MEKEPEFSPENKEDLGEDPGLKLEIKPTAPINLPGEDAPGPEKDGGKSILIMISVIIGIFVLFFGGFYFYNHYAAPEVVSVDDLHQENLGGELDEEEGYVYNGFSFVKADGFWWTEINRHGTLLKVPLRFGPKEVENISQTGKIDEAGFNNGSIIFVSLNDPGAKNKYYNLAISELQSNIKTGIKRIPIGACAQPNYLCENITIINCQNAKGAPVIELDPKGETKISYQGSCMKLSGEEDGILKAVDYIVLHWYGILE